jgi:flagellar biosynthesis chaperone FliJ
MEKGIISENLVKNVLTQILSEETSKVRREEFNRVQFKLEELQNSLGETMKELRKLEDSIPSGLKSVCNGRVSGISSNLMNTNKLITQLKEKIRSHKKSLYTQQVEEKKK